MNIEINVVNQNTATVTIAGKTATVHRTEGVTESSALGEGTDDTFGGIIADNVIPLVQNIMEAMEYFDAPSDSEVWADREAEQISDLEDCFF